MIPTATSTNPGKSVKNGCDQEDFVQNNKKRDEVVVMRQKGTNNLLKPTVASIEIFYMEQHLSSFPFLETFLNICKMS